MRSLLGAASHLALWAGLYQAALFVFLATLLSVRPSPWAIGFVASLAACTYLVDRAKLHPSFVDPADIETHPDRVRFLNAHRTMATECMIATATLALLCALAVSPWLVPLIPCALLGVLWYAHPRTSGRRRPKQVYVLKNAIVASSIVALCAVVVLLQPPAAPTPVAFSLLTAAVCCWLQVFADAAACDIDDTPGDRKFNIDTIPVRSGARRTSGLVVALKVCSLLPAILSAGHARGDIVVMWLLTVAAAIIALLVFRGRVRDATEIAFMLAVASSWVISTNLM